MNLMILGATGRTGQQVTAQALSRGHHVTAVVRTALPGQKNGLRVVVADPCKLEQLAGALSEGDTVISCLGQRPGGNPWLIRDAVAATLQAMQQVGARRLLLVSGALLYRTLNPMALILQRVMADRLRDGRAAEEQVLRSALDWTIVRPPRLTEGSIGKGYQVKVGDRPGLSWSLQFYDLATCLLDLGQGKDHVRQIVGVSSL